MKSITLQGLLGRFVIALALVYLTWNPSPVNYVRWAMNQWSELGPFVLFVGLALITGWVVFLRATLRALGTFGIVLAVALAGSILWILIRYDIVDPTNASALAWVILALFALVLAGGLSWSHLRRAWSGQSDVLEADDEI